MGHLTREKDFSMKTWICTAPWGVALVNADTREEAFTKLREYEEEKSGVAGGVFLLCDESEIRELDTTTPGVVYHFSN